MVEDVESQSYKPFAISLGEIRDRTYQPCMRPTQFLSELDGRVLTHHSAVFLSTEFMYGFEDR